MTPTATVAAGPAAHAARTPAERPSAGSSSPMDGRTVVRSGWGRSDDYRTSDVVALLKAPDRWGGIA
ncbi:hypothetical protein ACLQ28_14480 [Micromonospora sp. DT201]|uniref:hypothetical protein n=1 Tax=Micromonospora sp. DT201 TaxID=3393442 RepID=UPI003CFB1057